MRETICVAIKQKETGRKIRKLMVEHGYSVRDIQEMMGFESPRAVYKWLAGDSLPTVDNLLILSRILHTNMESILVYDGDFSVDRLKKEQRFIYQWNSLTIVFCVPEHVKLPSENGHGKSPDRLRAI